MLTEQLIFSVRFCEENGFSHEMVAKDGGTITTNHVESINSILKESTNRHASKINISKV